jgi:hypothetical protein
MRALRMPVLAVLAALSVAAPAASQTLEDQLAASDAAFGAQFGASLDQSLDTVVAGARAVDGGLGAAYVFRRGTGGVWTQEARLAGADAVAQDQVGHAVAIEGDLMLAGAPDPFDLFGPVSGPGAVYVFERTGTLWAQADKLTAGDGQSLDQLGYSVGISADRIVAGARGEQAAGSGSRFGGRGAAYVFRSNGGGWVQEAKLLAGDAADGDRFGEAAAIDGDLLVIGAPGEDALGADAGAAYVFRRSGTSWTQEAKLLASDGAADDSFGFTVSISGNAVAVGSYLNDGNGVDAGAVYVYRESGGIWSEEQRLVASDIVAGDYHGYAVDLVGDRLLAGSYAAGGGAGALYLYEKSGPSWTETSKLTQVGSVLLGAAAAVTPDFAAGGAPFTDTTGSDFSGAAWVWCTNPGPILFSIAPDEGLFHQNTPVTLTGANFSQVKLESVSFDGVPATGVTWVSDSTVTAVSPTGTQGQVADVTLTQDGQDATLTGAYTFAGTAIASLTPDSGPSVGGPPVTISGSYFVDDGSTVVTFGGTPANIVSITEPGTIVVDVPPGTRGTSVDVTVTSTNGTDTLVGGWTYELLSILAVDVAGGNLTGGSLVTLDVNHPTTLGDTTATLDGSPVTVTAVTATSVQIQTPAVAEATGLALDITITNSNGSDTAVGAFTYTPALYASVVGTAAAGGTLTIDWLADPAVGPGQLVFVWLGDPLAPPLSLSLPGYAGRLRELPFLFLLSGVNENSAPVDLVFGPVDPVIAGLPLDLQGLVTGEGAASGSFTNVATFVIP